MTGERPPAGWYHDGRGLRWWDGIAWGPYAPLPPPTALPPPVASGPDPVLWATLVHVGFVAGGFVGPLVVRLTEGREDDFVRHHSTEAVNANLTLLAAYVGAYLPGFIATAATNVLWPMITGLGLTIVVAVLMLAQMITAAVRASQGRWFRYPVTIRFVRGAIARGEERPVVPRRAPRPVASRPTVRPAPVALPSPGRLLWQGAVDLRRRRKAWAVVASAMVALTVSPYFVAVGVNDLVFGYDLWNDVPPSEAADAFAVVSLIASFVVAFSALAVGWGWMAALGTDPSAGARTALRRGTLVAWRRVWYAAPAVAVAVAACGTLVGAPLAVAALATAAFGTTAPRPGRAGWVGRAFLPALAIGLVVAGAVFVVYLLWAIAAVVDTGTLGNVTIFVADLVVVVAAMVLVAAALGALQRADAEIHPSP